VLNPIFLVCRLACIFLDCIHTLHCKLPNPIFFAFIMHEIEVDREFNLIYFYYDGALFAASASRGYEVGACDYPIGPRGC